MVPSPPLPALRLNGQDFALEAGREYLLGSAANCDLRVEAPHVAPHHARLRVIESGVEGVIEATVEITVEITDLGSSAGTSRNGFRIDVARLQVGDTIQFGDGSAMLVHDDGLALIVPEPALRAEAERRRWLARLPIPAVRRIEAPGFQDLMAEELQRAPWLAVSLVAHAVLLLLLWLLFPEKPPGGDTRSTVTIDVSGGPKIQGETPPVLEVVPEKEPEQPVALEPPPEQVDAEVVEDTPREIHPIGTIKVNPQIARRPDPPKASAQRGLARRNLQGVGSEGFQKTVADLQASGLEIVFVFDSTGSMGTTIKDTKNTIAEMLEVLRALVPDARVGLVTYRDRGRNEEYLLRQVPLGLDFWLASNFVHGVSAEGGGDRTEAVREGLSAAFAQNWKSNSKRVVILAGDAPAHAEDWRKLISEVKTFASRKSSFVHTLVTSPNEAGKDTHEQFARIAEAGGGECLALEKHESVLQRVLDLAFGRQYGGDLASVRRSIAEGSNKTETWALDLCRRGGPELTAALREQPVEAALVNALIRMPKQKVVVQIVDLLGDQGTPPHSRHAIAWVLQRVLVLSAPPVDPTTGAAPSEKETNRLRQLAGRLPG